MSPTPPWVVVAQVLGCRPLLLRLLRACLLLHLHQLLALLLLLLLCCGWWWCLLVAQLHWSQGGRFY